MRLIRRAGLWAPHHRCLGATVLVSLSTVVTAPGPDVCTTALTGKPARQMSDQTVAEEDEDESWQPEIEIHAFTPPWVCGLVSAVVGRDSHD